MKPDLKTPIMFDTFEEARDWASKNVKGLPAWRVELLDTKWVIRSSPNQYLINKEGNVIRP